MVPQYIGDGAQLGLVQANCKEMDICSQFFTHVFRQRYCYYILVDLGPAISRNEMLQFRIYLIPSHYRDLNIVLQVNIRRKRSYLVPEPKPRNKE